jgi:hypothetical protein
VCVLLGRLASAVHKSGRVEARERLAFAVHKSGRVEARERLASAVHKSERVEARERALSVRALWSEEAAVCTLRLWVQRACEVRALGSSK